MKRSLSKDNIQTGSNVTIESRNVITGETVTIASRNLVVNNGLDLLRDLLGGTGHRPSHIGLGTGVTAVTATDTSIETEQFRGEITRRDDLTAAIEFQLFLGINDGNGFTYVEAGLLETGQQNGDSGDPATLVARDNFTGVAKNNTVELTLTWTITLAAS